MCNTVAYMILRSVRQSLLLLYFGKSLLKNYGQRLIIFPEFLLIEIIQEVETPQCDKSIVYGFAGDNLS